MPRRKRNVGLPPGSMYYTGSKLDQKVMVHYCAFSSDEFSSETYEQTKSLLLHASDTSLVQWYDVRGLHDIEVIRAIGNRFAIHPLALEDAVDIHNRPLFRPYSTGDFFAFKALQYDKKNHIIEKQHVSVYVGNGFVISFQEHDDDLFDSIRKRLVDSLGRVRSRGADYLAYVLVDFLVDQYYVVLELIDDRVQELEEVISEDIGSFRKEDLYQLKKDLLLFRKSVAPLRDAIGQWSRSESSIIQDATVPYLRDVHDHVIQLLDAIDSNRDILSSLQDLYLSESSMRMNSVMQFLTIITAIFVPLSFLTGVYGMNFVNIPELQNPFGYYILIGVMIILVLIMLWWFRRKKWL